MAEHRSRIDIEAPAEVVFTYLTTAEGLTAWMGDRATLHPVADGIFSVDIAGHPIRGRYLVVDPPRRVVVSWGIAGSEELPAGSSQVTFDLTPIPTGTRVQVTHSGVPAPDLPGHTRGWAHFLPRLRTLAHGGVPGPDPWNPENG